MKRFLSIVTMAILTAALATLPAAADWDPLNPEDVARVKMHFAQLPDPTGWDIEIASFNNQHECADDWMCTETGPVNDIHFWVSWLGDDVALDLIDAIVVTIYDNDLSGPFSKPGNALWQATFDQTQYTMIPYGTGNQGFADPQQPWWVPNDHTQFQQVNIVDIPNPFIQQQGEIYWLGIYVYWNSGPHNPVGWKTADVFSYPDPYTGSPYEDTAVFRDLSSAWVELRDGITQEPLDFSFVITGTEPGTLGACCTDSAPSGCQLMTAIACTTAAGDYLGDSTICLGDADGDSVDDACDNCTQDPNPAQANSDIWTVKNGTFESPPVPGIIPHEFSHFTKNYRGGSVVEAGYGCTGDFQTAATEATYSFDGGQAVHLDAFSGDPLTTGEPCHRETGVHSAGTFDLTGRTKLSAWVTDFTHSAAATCEHARTQFRLDDGSDFVNLDLFNIGQYVPVPPGYGDYVETATGTDGRTWRRFEVDVPIGWAKPDVGVTILTMARSWCAGRTVGSSVFVDNIEFFPREDAFGDACDNCPQAYNPDQKDSESVVNRGFESPQGGPAEPDDFSHFMKNYRGGAVVEAGYTCTGDTQIGQCDATRSRSGSQAVYLYADSGNPATTGEPCHRESGMLTLGTYDLTGRSKLSAWITDFAHTSAATCEHARTQFRLDDGSGSEYLDLFNIGQYVPVPPGYGDYVETAIGTDGRTWRRFEADIPVGWMKPGVTITALTMARSWCAGWTVYSELYIDDIAILPPGDPEGDACDGCPTVPSLPGNVDGDAADDDCDCLPGDPTAFHTPYEIRNLSLSTNMTTIEWESDAPYSGVGTAYDVMRGDLTELPAGAGAGEACLGPWSVGMTFEDPATPALSGGFYYLVRGVNNCSPGTYGYESSGSQRVTLICP